MVDMIILSFRLGLFTYYLMFTHNGGLTLSRFHFTSLIFKQNLVTNLVSSTWSFDLFNTYKYCLIPSITSVKHKKTLLNITKYCWIFVYKFDVTAKNKYLAIIITSGYEIVYIEDMIWMTKIPIINVFIIQICFYLFILILGKGTGGRPWKSYVNNLCSHHGTFRPLQIKYLFFGPARTLKFRLKISKKCFLTISSTFPLHVSWFLNNLKFKKKVARL